MRVTCRDWFQLSLKEGLTVFHDQEFSSDMGSHTVKRIADVSRLQNYQFPQDAGPVAHPVRPHSHIKRKFCGREGTVLMVTGRGHPLTHALSQSEQYAPLMLFDCRGYEPVEFAFGSGWKVESMDDDDERITNVRGRL